MSEINVKKLAMSFSLLCFAILALGSILAGAEVVTGFIRGIEGAVVFGLLAWAVGSLLVEDEVEEEEPQKESEEEKGKNLNQTV